MIGRRRAALAIGAFTVGVVAVIATVNLGDRASQHAEPTTKDAPLLVEESPSSNSNAKTPRAQTSHETDPPITQRALRRLEASLPPQAQQQLRWARSLDSFRERLNAFIANAGSLSKEESLDEIVQLVDEAEFLDQGRAFLPGEAFRLKRYIISRANISADEKKRLVEDLPPPSDFRKPREERPPTERMLEERALVRRMVDEGASTAQIEAELDKRYREGLRRAVVVGQP